MNDSSNDESSEVVKVVDEFTNMVKRDKFKEQCLQDRNLMKNAKGLMNILEQIFRSVGVTEYTNIDGGYTGDQILERYKRKQTQSWNNKTDKSRYLKSITKDEVEDRSKDFLQRRAEFERKREMRRIESGKTPRTLEMDPDSGYPVYIGDADDEDGSSEDDSDAIVDEILNSSIEGRQNKLRILQDKRRLQTIEEH